MKTASVNEIKQALGAVPQAKLVQLCLRLAKFKKDNKELLTYLLFEADDETAYINSVKQEMDELFAGVNTSHVFFAKKTVRKILRVANKHIRYIGSAQAETELLLHFCSGLKATGLPLHKNTVLANLYQGQWKKMYKALESLHEDLQYDYMKEVSRLEEEF
ncbi:MAG: hypothetical protein JST39_13850 [Bacteroidetes bacterium]|nr:hypothetical protein [Bacteroidota bacterium]